MSDDTDVLGIIWWIKLRDGKEIRTYRSRGRGQKYNRLYKWLPTTSYKCIGEDFPWDYWIFTDEADHDKMCALFGTDVRHEKESDETYKETLI